MQNSYAEHTDCMHLRLAAFECAVYTVGTCFEYDRNTAITRWKHVGNTSETRRIYDPEDFFFLYHLSLSLSRSLSLSLSLSRCVPLATSLLFQHGSCTVKTSPHLQQV